MKSLLTLCLIIITASCLYMAWMMRGSSYGINDAHKELMESHRELINSHRINMAFATDEMKKALDQRNLAEAHVTLLQRGVAKYHRSGWKEGKK